MFLYYVSITGVTGARKSFANKLSDDIGALKKLTNKPLCVGFGVSSTQQAKDIASIADGVIVGSAIINVLEADLKNKKNMVSEVGKFAAKLAKAVHGKK